MYLILIKAKLYSLFKISLGCISLYFCLEGIVNFDVSVGQFISLDYLDGKITEEEYLAYKEIARNDPFIVATQYFAHGLGCVVSVMFIFSRYFINRFSKVPYIA